MAKLIGRFLGGQWGLSQLGDPVHNVNDMSVSRSRSQPATKCHLAHPERAEMGHQRPRTREAVGGGLTSKGRGGGRSSAVPTGRDQGETRWLLPRPASQSAAGASHRSNPSGSQKNLKPRDAVWGPRARGRTVGRSWLWV